MNRSMDSLLHACSIIECDVVMDGHNQKIVIQQRVHEHKSYHTSHEMFDGSPCLDGGIYGYTILYSGICALEDPRCTNNYS